MRLRLRFTWGWLATGLWLAADSSACAQPQTVYVNREGGFQLSVPERWVVSDRSTPTVRALLEATRAAAQPSQQAFEPGLVAIFSEFPVGASVDFNSNFAVSMHPGAPPALHDPEATLDEMAARLFAGLPGWKRAVAERQLQRTGAWLWADYRYEQSTGHRTVPIRARIAMTADHRNSRYLLLTASCPDERFQEYEAVILACLQSLRWLDDGQSPTDR